MTQDATSAPAGGEGESPLLGEASGASGPLQGPPDMIITQPAAAGTPEALASMEHELSTRLLWRIQSTAPKNGGLEVVVDWARMAGPGTAEKIRTTVVQVTPQEGQSVTASLVRASIKAVGQQIRAQYLTANVPPKENDVSKFAGLTGSFADL